MLPESTVLGLAPRDEIVLDEAGFMQPARVYPSAIGAPYGE